MRDETMYFRSYGSSKLTRLPSHGVMLLLLLLLAGCGGNSKNTGVEDIGQPPGLTDSTAPIIRDFILGPGDEIGIGVFGHKELDKRVRVEPNGEFYYPLIGYLNVEGMTSKELRSVITEKISKYYVDPDVGVSIVASRSQKIFILGEVHQSGVFPLEQPTTIFEAVLKAGGFNSRAKKSSIMLVRYVNGKSEVRKLDLEKVYKEGEYSNNIYLQGGDIIYVPSNVVTNIEDFVDDLSVMMRPFLDIERGVILWPTFVDVLQGQNIRGRTK